MQATIIDVAVDDVEQLLSTIQLFPGATCELEEATYTRVKILLYLSASTDCWIPNLFLHEILGAHGRLICPRLMLPRAQVSPCLKALNLYLDRPLFEVFHTQPVLDYQI